MEAGSTIPLKVTITAPLRPACGSNCTKTTSSLPTSHVASPDHGLRLRRKQARRAHLIYDLLDGVEADDAGAPLVGARISRLALCSRSQDKTEHQRRSDEPQPPALPARWALGPWLVSCATASIHLMPGAPHLPRSHDNNENGSGWPMGRVGPGQEPGVRPVLSMRQGGERPRALGARFKGRPHPV